MFTRQVFRAARPIKHVSSPIRLCEVSSDLTGRQSIRRYATEEPPPSSHRGIIAFASIVLVGSAGTGYLITRRNDARAAAQKKPSVTQTEAKKAFTGGEQGFIDLKLDSVDNINHNTKRFRYALPEPEMVSGLQIACKIPTQPLPPKSPSS